MQGSEKLHSSSCFEADTRKALERLKLVIWKHGHRICSEPMKQYRGVSLALALLAASPASAFMFAEGHSSAKPGASAALSYREFTIYLAEEACAHSPVPSRIEVRLARSSLSIGERIHRTSSSELIVEAYDEEGRFLPEIPILVDVDAPLDVAGSRADWDYLEARGAGEAKVVVTWLCGNVRGAVDFNVVPLSRNR